MTKTIVINDEEYAPRVWFYNKLRESEPELSGWTGYGKSSAPFKGLDYVKIGLGYYHNVNQYDEYRERVAAHIKKSPPKKKNVSVEKALLERIEGKLDAIIEQVGFPEVKKSHGLFAVKK